MSNVNSVGGSIEPRFNWKLIAVVALLLIFTGGTTYGTTWYFMDQELQRKSEEYDKEKEEYENQMSDLDQEIEELNETLSYYEDLSIQDISSWKTYTESDRVYSLEYPQNWVYNDGYNVSPGVSLVTLGAGKDDLLSEVKTGKLSGIMMYAGFEESIIDEYLEKEEDEETGLVKVSEIKVGDSFAKKMVLSPGADSNYPKATIVYYEIEIENNKYIRIINLGNYQQKIFNKMLETFKSNIK